MPTSLISCVSLPNATRFSVPIYDFSNEHEELQGRATEHYFVCCGKGVCGGCVHSCIQSGNDDKCPFCNSEGGKTDEEQVEQIRKRVDANDPASIYLLARYYYYGGLNGVQQDHAKAMELFTKSAELGSSKAHSNLAGIYHQRGDLKKAKFHLEAAAMAGHEGARFNLGMMEYNSGNMERAIKHWTIAASAGCYRSMHELITLFKKCSISRESIDSTLAAYNSSCAEMRSEARDSYYKLGLCFQEGSVTRESIDSTLAAYNSSCAEMRSEARDAFIPGRTERI